MASSCNYAGGSFYFELTAGQTPCEQGSPSSQRDRPRVSMLFLMRRIFS